MRFEVLGPMRIIGPEGAHPVAGARQRTVLAALLAQANRPVPVEVLVETVWDGAPPDGAAVSLRAHIMRLRRGLGAEAGSRIRTYEAGYLVQVREEELDASEFEALCRGGRRGDPGPPVGRSNHHRDPGPQPLAWTAAGRRAEPNRA